MKRVHQTLVFQLVLASITTVTTGLDMCITVSSINDYSLIGHTYKTSSGKSLLTCIISCDQDVHCYRINYKIPIKTCELSDATRYSHPEELAFSPGAVHFDHPSRPSGSCVGDWPCKNVGKCVNLPRDPGFKCHCQNDYVGDTCSVCSSPPLGMQDRQILDHQLTASSEGMWFNLRKFKARDARLWLTSSSWVCGVMDPDPWIQISFAPEIKLICGIATQGSSSHDWWTTSYKLKYSLTGKSWRDYENAEGFAETFLGNSDRSKVVKHKLSVPIKAAFVRVLPLTKKGRSALRLEVYGCDFFES